MSSSDQEPGGQIGAERVPGGFGQQIGPPDPLRPRRPPRRLAAPPARRWLALLLIPGLLLGAAYIDRSDEGGASSTADRDQAGNAATGGPSGFGPVAPPDDVLASAWYCAGGTAVPGGRADHEVYLANLGDTEATATVRVYPSEGDVATERVEIPARFRSAVRLGDVVEAPFAAALVETRGGEVVVEHRVSGPLGSDTAPCATAASDLWYSAGGSTLTGHDQVLAIFNPFPADAIVDITVIAEGGEPATSDDDSPGSPSPGAPSPGVPSTTTIPPGADVRRPGDFQGLPVPARSLVIARVTEQVRRRAQIVATVEARTGRVVVDHLQSYGGALVPPPEGEPDPTGLDPSLGDVQVPPGLTVSLAVPRPNKVWAFPDGRKLDGAHESYVIYNPSDEAADVDVTVTPSGAAPEGEEGAPPEVAPFEITGLAPDSFQVINLDVEDRVPEGEHSTVVRSVNGVPVVARRVLYGTAPWDHSGAEATSGSAVAARRWMLATGTTVPATDEQIVLYNPGEVQATATVTLIDSGEQVRGFQRGPIHVEVAPGARGVVALGELPLPATDLATVVEADQPVIVERSLQQNTGIGLSSSIAIPEPDSAAVLQ